MSAETSDSGNNDSGDDNDSGDKLQQRKQVTAETMVAETSESSGSEDNDSGHNNDSRYKLQQRSQVIADTSDSEDKLEQRRQVRIAETMIAETMTNTR